MTLRVSEMSPASTIVVLGSIYVPKQQQVDQLVLLSNSQCPVIDVNVKVPCSSVATRAIWECSWTIW